VRNTLTAESLRDLESVCTEAVTLLISRGHKARVGKNSGMAYPAIKRGVWTVALLLDTGFGWKCPLYDSIGQPHWDWFMTSNMDMVDVGVAYGLAYELLGKAKSPDLISRSLEYILMYPCRVPNNRCSEKFECPRCYGDWDTKISDPGTIGRAFNFEWSLYPESGTVEPEGWDDSEARLLFGEENYEQPVNVKL